MYIARPTNWKVQGIGLGFEIVAGAATVVFPAQQWLARVFFAIGTLLILLPFLLWSLWTIGIWLGVRSPIDLKSPWRRTISTQQLIGAVAALTAIVGFVVFVSARVVDMQAQVEREGRELAQRKIDMTFFVSELEKQLVVGDQLESRKVKTDLDLYQWLLDVGGWQAKTFYFYDQGLRLGVFSEVEKGEFNKVASLALSDSFNRIHGDYRGYMLARLAVMRSHIKKLQGQLDVSAAR